MVGAIDGDPMSDLLNKLESGPIIKDKDITKDWPEGVRKDYINGLHKFMAILTEVSHQSKKWTVLYIPNEDLSDPENAAKDKDLL